MSSWTFYPAFLGTVISMIGLTRIAVQEHDHEHPRTLSELAAAEQYVLRHFRTILWICGTLFAITTYCFIVPRLGYALLAGIAWSVTFAGEMLLALLPARGKTRWMHDVLAELMGIGMLTLAVAFTLQHNLHGAYMVVEVGIGAAMALLGILTVLDRRRFIFYELPFIYLSHFSILVAALAVR